MSISHYNSWQDYAAGEAKSVAQVAKVFGQWYELREHASNHTDTLTDRIAP